MADWRSNLLKRKASSSSTGEIERTDGPMLQSPEQPKTANTANSKVGSKLRRPAPYTPAGIPIDSHKHEAYIAKVQTVGKESNAINASKEQQDFSFDTCDKLIEKLTEASACATTRLKDVNTMLEELHSESDGEAPASSEGSEKERSSKRQRLGEEEHVFGER